MEIKVNNNTVKIQESTSILQDIIDNQGIKSKILVCKVNNKIVRKQDRKNFVIKEGDEVVIIPIVSGG